MKARVSFLAHTPPAPKKRLHRFDLFLGGEKGGLSTSLRREGGDDLHHPFLRVIRLPPRGKVGQRMSFGVERVPVQRDHVSVREQQVQVLERFRLGRVGVGDQYKVSPLKSGKRGEN